MHTIKLGIFVWKFPWGTLSFLVRNKFVWGNSAASVGKFEKAEKGGVTSQLPSHVSQFERKAAQPCSCSDSIIDGFCKYTSPSYKVYLHTGSTDNANCASDIFNCHVLFQMPWHVMQTFMV